MSTAEQEPQAQGGMSPFLRNILVAVVLIAAFGVVYYIGYQKKAHRLDTFAKCLTDRGVKMYGAYWCPHCAEQKELFGQSFQFVPYVECGVYGNRNAESEVCKDAGIKHFPTWQFPPVGERVEQVIPLENLASRTGCSLQ